MEMKKKQEFLRKQKKREKIFRKNEKLEPKLRHSRFRFISAFSVARSLTHINEPFFLANKIFLEHKIKTELYSNHPELCGEKEIKRKKQCVRSIRPKKHSSESHHFRYFDVPMFIQFGVFFFFVPFRSVPFVCQLYLNFD